MKYPSFSGTEPCTQIGMDLYFVDPSGNGVHVFKEVLARACARCPMLEQCRTWALHHEEYGVWGGTTARERYALRKKLGIKFQPLEKVR